MNIQDYFSSFMFYLYSFIEDNMIGYLRIEYFQGAMHFDVEEGLSHIPITGYMEIPDVDGISEDKMCEYLNSAELKRASESLDRIKGILKKIPESKMYQNKKGYYENVIGKYIDWYEMNGIQLTDTTGTLNAVEKSIAIDKPKMKTRPKDPNRDEMIKQLNKQYYGLRKDTQQK